MAGRPKKRARQAVEEGILSPEVLAGEVLPPEGSLPTGNGPAQGSYVSFADLPPETLREYQQRALRKMKDRKERERLAKLDGYLEFQRSLGALMALGRESVIAGLLEEMRVTDEDGTERIDTSQLDDRRLKVLLAAIKDAEGVAFPKPKETTEVEVSVVHRLEQMTKRLGGGS